MTMAILKFIKLKLWDLYFWLTVFVVLILGKYYRWINTWTATSTAISIVILLLTMQYCVLHAIKLRKCHITCINLLFAELTYFFASIFVIWANTVWLSNSNQINLGYLVILSVLLSPNIIINAQCRINHNG